MRDALALHGGEKSAKVPFPPWPQFCDRTLVDVLEPLRDGRVASWAGHRGADLERHWAAWLDVPHAVSCSSGTAALHMALLSLGIGPGDEVIVPSHTFISTSLAVLQAGAVPLFCDICDDQTLDPRGIAPLVTPRTRAIIAVHLFGIVCDMDRILQVSREHSLSVVEDCAQCIGGEHRGRKAGSLGDAGCFSFSQSKHLSTGGEGGMVVTRDPVVARTCVSLRDYGREEDSASCTAHVRLGYNYRLTELQSAIGLSEMTRLDSWNLPRRRGYARIYDHAFSQLYGVRSLPLNKPERMNAYWKYPLQLDLDKLSCGIEELREAVVAEGIPDAGSLWPETYDEPLFKDRPPTRCANAEAVRGRSVVLGLPPSWEKSHIETCAAAVRKVLHAYKR
jgi:dTDP-4-amino-4,6-dideoxygalactose transaminase